MSSTATAPIFYSNRCNLVMPGMGTIQGFRARIQASAICAVVVFLRSGILLSDTTRARFVLRREARNDVAGSRSYLGISITNHRDVRLTSLVPTLPVSSLPTTSSRSRVNIHSGGESLSRRFYRPLRELGINAEFKTRVNMLKAITVSESWGLTNIGFPSTLLYVYE